jgi:hypothetical protein
MFLSVTDCQGQPVAGLLPADFHVTENATELSTAPARIILPPVGQRAFLSLVLEMTAATSRR